MHRNEGDENRGYQQGYSGKLRTIIEILGEPEHRQTHLDCSHALLVGDQQRPEVVIENGTETMDGQRDHHSLADGNQEGGKKADIAATFDECGFPVLAAHSLEILAQHENMGGCKQRGAYDSHIRVGQPQRPDGRIIG